MKSIAYMYSPSSGYDLAPITVTTDKVSYNNGDKLTISGATQDYISGTPVSVIVRNPIGNVVQIAQVDLASDRTYSATFTVGGSSLWQAAGTYEVDVQFGSKDRSAKTTFEFSGSGVVPSQNTMQLPSTQPTPQPTVNPTPQPTINPTSNQPSTNSINPTESFPIMPVIIGIVLAIAIGIAIMLFKRRKTTSPVKPSSDETSIY